MRNRKGSDNCCCSTECLKYSVVPSEGKPWPSWSLVSGDSPTEGSQGELIFDTPGVIEYTGLGDFTDCSGTPGSPQTSYGKPLHARIHLKTADAHVRITYHDGLVGLSGAPTIRETVEFLVYDNVNQKYPVVHVIWKEFQDTGQATEAEQREEYILDKFANDIDEYVIEWRNKDCYPTYINDGTGGPTGNYGYQKYSDAPTNYPHSEQVASITPITPDKIYTAQAYLKYRVPLVGSRYDDGQIMIEAVAGQVEVSNLRLYYVSQDDATEVCEGCPSDIPTVPFTVYPETAGGDTTSMGMTGTVPSFLHFEIPSLSAAAPPYDDPGCDCDAEIGSGDVIQLELFTYDETGDTLDDGYPFFLYLHTGEGGACGIPGTYDRFVQFDISLQQGELGFTNTIDPDWINTSPLWGFSFAGELVGSDYRLIWEELSILDRSPALLSNGELPQQMVHWNMWITFDHAENILEYNDDQSAIDQPCVAVGTAVKIGVQSPGLPDATVTNYGAGPVWP